MVFTQTLIRLPPYPRGFHLITREVLSGGPQLSGIETGVLHLFLQHTSASLLVNENADPDVRADLERWANQAVPESAAYFEHTLEGSDDMPAHVKGVVFGPSLLLPIAQGKLALGTWQGVYLGEHRNEGGSRKIMATAWGAPRTGR